MTFRDLAEAFERRAAATEPVNEAARAASAAWAHAARDLRAAIAEDEAEIAAVLALLERCGRCGEPFESPADHTACFGSKASA